MSSVVVPKKHPRSSNKLPVETVKPWNKATNSPSSGCKKLSDVVVYEAFEASVYGSMAFRGNQISAGSMKMVQASWIASVDGVIDLCCTALQIHCGVRRPVLEKANPTSIAIKLPMLVAYAINQKKRPINREVDLHKSVWWYRNYDHIFQIFSRYPNSFRTRFHYRHQKVAVSTANVSCFIGEKSLICICLMSLGSKQTNNMHRIEAYHICDWNGIEWILFLSPKTRLKRGYLRYNSHPKKGL